MIVRAIADLHGRFPDIPECDCLVIAGDICPDFGSEWDYGLMRARQMEWLDDIWREWEKDCPAKHILMTPGNHDWITELPQGLRTRFFVDEGCEIEGVKFWFTPWIPPILDWNYMLDRHVRKERFALIPEGLDLLVSHSPAHNVLDRTWQGEHVGCPELRQAIYRAQPRVCVFGHIHEGYRDGLDGEALGKTLMYNVSLMSRNESPRALIL